MDPFAEEEEAQSSAPVEQKQQKRARKRKRPSVEEETAAAGAAAAVAPMDATASDEHVKVECGTGAWPSAERHAPDAELKTRLARARQTLERAEHVRQSGLLRLKDLRTFSQLAMKCVQQNAALSESERTALGETVRQMHARVEKYEQRITNMQEMSTHAVYACAVVMNQAWARAHGVGSVHAWPGLAVYNGLPHFLNASVNAAQRLSMLRQARRLAASNDGDSVSDVLPRSYAGAHGFARNEFAPAALVPPVSRSLRGGGGGGNNSSARRDSALAPPEEVARGEEPA